MKLALQADSLQYVCDEIVGKDKWYFHPSDNRYVRLSEEKNITSHCFGKFLPNPKDIRRNAGRDASDATKALWAHWIGGSSVNPHN